MPKYKYKAKNTPKEITEGIIEAESEENAITRLNERGFFPISVELVTGPPQGFQIKRMFSKKVSLRDINIFTRELADLLGAGFPLLRAMNILRDQTESRRLKEVIDEMATVIKEGGTLSGGLLEHDDVFSDIYINMVRAGEIGGTLQGTLDHLADFFDKEEEFRSKIQQVIAYPIFLCVVGFATIAVLMTFVIPKLVLMFKDTGQALPVPTMILITISAFLKNFWWLIALVGVSAFMGLKELVKQGPNKAAFDALKLKLPLLGGILKKMEVARCVRTLSVLLNSGISMLHAIEIATETVENEVIKSELVRLHKEVREGSTIAKSIINSKVFPAFVTNMIAVGEETGSLEEALMRIANAFSREVEKSMRIVMSLLEPVMILVMGSIVGFIVISMLLPIFQYSVAVH